MKKWMFFAFLLTFVLVGCTSMATSVAEPTTAAYPDSEAKAPQPTAEQAYPAPDVAQPAATDAYPAPESGVSSTDVIVFVIDPAASTLSYEVGETFISQGNKFATAIGVTTDINGSVTIDSANPQNSTVSTITADISKFQSDSSRRDNKIRNDFLESAKFPTVTFVPTEVIGFPENPQPGESYTFQIVGDTTIRETTLPLTFDVTVNVTEEMLIGSATTTFLMSDFGFGPISLAGMLKTEDDVKITFDFVALP